jgi:WD40 repeat protein
VAFSPDGKTLVATYLSMKSSAMIWNTTDWIAHTESGCNSAAFSKDGSLLALGWPGIKLIEPVSRKQIREIELPGCGVFALAFSPDGQTLAAGCADGTVRLVRTNP